MREEVNFQVRHCGCVSSTQDVAKRLVSFGGEVGAVIVADEQQHGRGRFGRTWLSPKGGLYASLILSPEMLLPLRVGIAVAEALRTHAVNAMLKWPNDVLVGEKKIAGVLTEIIDERAIVGIGVNLGRIQMATASSIAQETSRVVCRDELLDLILARITSASPESVLTRYRALSATIGQTVRVEVSGSAVPNSIVGTAVDIDSTGRLLVTAGDAVYPIASGECVHLRHAPLILRGRMHSN